MRGTWPGGEQRWWPGAWGAPGEGTTWRRTTLKGAPELCLGVFFFATKLHPYCWVLGLLDASGGGRKWWPCLLLSLVLLLTFSSPWGPRRWCQPFPSFPKGADAPVSNQRQRQDPGLSLNNLWVGIGVTLPQVHDNGQNRADVPYKHIRLILNKEHLWFWTLIHICLIAPR